MNNILDEIDILIKEINDENYKQKVEKEAEEILNRTPTKLLPYEEWYQYWRTIYSETYFKSWRYNVGPSLVDYIRNGLLKLIFIVIIINSFIPNIKEKSKINFKIQYHP